MSEELILYDLPSQDRCSCWSLNPWKTRLILNYKNIPYKTEWIEYPDLESTLKSFGLEPNPPAVGPPYSIPTIKTPDGKYIMDSREIAPVLEELRPEPPLHLDSEYLEKAYSVVKALWAPLRAITLPRVPDMLPPRSAEYFHRTRVNLYDMPLKDVPNSEFGGERAWRDAEPGLQMAKELLNANEGPFVMGKEASYADFVMVGLWRILERCDRDGDLFGRVFRYDESFSRQYSACAPWLKRDD